MYCEETSIYAVGDRSMLFFTPVESKRGLKILWARNTFSAEKSISIPKFIEKSCKFALRSNILEAQTSSLA